MECPVCGNTLSEPPCRLCGWEPEREVPVPDPIVTAQEPISEPEIRYEDPGAGLNAAAGKGKRKRGGWKRGLAVVVISGIVIFVVLQISGLIGQQAEPSPSASASKGYPVVKVDQGKECDRPGKGAFAAVGVANKSTSCGFAKNVRKAYLKKYPKGGSGKVKAKSPETKKTYTMTCSGSQPVLCKGGKAARVIIYGGKLKVGD